MPSLEHNGHFELCCRVGQATNRSPRGRSVLDTVVTSGIHRICTYPRGRGIAQAYEEGRDDAAPEDAAIRLAAAGLSWLCDALEYALAQYGKLPSAQLAGID